MAKMFRKIITELKHHAPFTIFGAATGIVIMLLIISAGVLSRVSRISPAIFYILHPVHVLLSAVVTTALYKLHKPRCKFRAVVLIGWVGSVGIATLSDSIIPYLGEMLLNLPNRGVHLGFVEEPYLTNLPALLGIMIGFLRPATKFPHAGHVLISTWASLFHIIMALGPTVNWVILLGMFLFLFLAVWIPCCASDIVFPLLFVAEETTDEHRNF